MLLFLNITYVLLAVAMIALILMQRGAGAQAGSGFGGGASGTVFGARGSSSFLTKATKWLAIAFFLISLFMAYHASNSLRGGADPAEGLGVMSQVPVTPVQPQGDGATVPGAPAQTGSVPSVPQAPAIDSAVPAAPGAAGQDTQPARTEVPVEPPAAEATNPKTAPPPGD
jgi:preprotein translocase subunit SecG